MTLGWWLLILWSPLYFVIGSVKRHTMDRLESFVSGTKGKRLTYKALIQ